MKGDNIMGLIAEYDAKQGECDSLRSQLAEAVALLRTYHRNIEGWMATSILPINALRHRHDQTTAFLARIDGATETKCARCGQVGIGRCGCGFQGETDGKAGAK